MSNKISALRQYIWICAFGTLHSVVALTPAFAATSGDSAPRDGMRFDLAAQRSPSEFPIGHFIQLLPSDNGRIQGKVTNVATNTHEKYLIGSMTIDTIVSYRSAYKYSALQNSFGQHGSATIDGFKANWDATYKEKWSSSASTDSFVVSLSIKAVRSPVGADTMYDGAIRNIRQLKVPTYMGLKAIAGDYVIKHQLLRTDVRLILETSQLDESTKKELSAAIRGEFANLASNGYDHVRKRIKTTSNIQVDVRVKGDPSLTRHLSPIFGPRSEDKRTLRLNETLEVIAKAQDAITNANFADTTGWRVYAATLISPTHIYDFPNIGEDVAINFPKAAEVEQTRLSISARFERLKSLRSEMRRLGMEVTHSKEFEDRLARLGMDLADVNRLEKSVASTNLRMPWREFDRRYRDAMAKLLELKSVCDKVDLLPMTYSVNARGEINHQIPSHNSGTKYHLIGSHKPKTAVSLILKKNNDGDKWGPLIADFEIKTELDTIGGYDEKYRIIENPNIERKNLPQMIETKLDEIDLYPLPLGLPGELSPSTSRGAKLFFEAASEEKVNYDKDGHAKSSYRSNGGGELKVDIEVHREKKLNPNLDLYLYSFTVKSKVDFAVSLSSSVGELIRYLSDIEYL